MATIDIWKILAGIAFFMLGMNFLEESVKSLSGRSFKLFLKKQTSNKLKAISGGAIVTGVLQSSSVVNLMVLAFVGAGIITMQNALAVVLGANLGSTLPNWIIATIGFKFDIENFALPVTGIAGIIMTFFKKENRWHQWSKILFALSLLFVGLDYIKTGIEAAMKEIDLSAFNEYPSIVFLLVGFLITSLIQSSSATMAIVLSALFANAISFYAATAIILGSEIGTTIKLLLAAIHGSAAKKRVALGNFFFNIITTLFAFIFLRKINNLITNVIGIHDNLIALVLFQTMVNTLGIILFYPFLHLLGRFLEKRFLNKENETLLLNKIITDDIDLSISTMNKADLQFIYYVINFSLESFGTNEEVIKREHLHKDFINKSLQQKYEAIKQLHGEVHASYIQIKKSPLQKTETERIDQLISSLRNGMYAAKSIKDAWLDIEQLRNSSNDIKYNLYITAKQTITTFYGQLTDLLQREKKDMNFEELVRILKLVTETYTQTLQSLYIDKMTQHLNETEISTLINFNREMTTSVKAMVFAIKDYLLNAKEADYFDDLPGFIR